ncbi:unnamed protein product [Cunninghamella blakesleeana]
MENTKTTVNDQYNHAQEKEHQTIYLTQSIVSDKFPSTVPPHYIQNDQDLLDTNSIFAEKKRKRLMIQRVAYMVIMNAVFPISLYYILKHYVPPVWALVLSSIPTILSVIIQAIFMRRIDSVGAGVIFGFTLSVVLASINGDPKLLLLRESFVTAALGLLCAITLIPIRIKTFTMKPILYYLARDLIPLKPVKFNDDNDNNDNTNNEDKTQSQDRMLFYWNNSSYFRRHLRILTIIDVFVLELEFGLKFYYILKFDLDTLVIISNLTLVAIGILVFLFTLWYILKIRKQLRLDEPSMLANANAIK